MAGINYCWPATIASGASLSSEIPIYNCEEIYLQLTTGTIWNAGAGNASFTVLGRVATDVTAAYTATITGATLATDPAVRKIYPLSNVQSCNYLQLWVGTACTSTLSALIIGRTHSY